MQTAPRRTAAAAPAARLCAVALLALPLAGVAGPPPAVATDLAPEAAGRFVELALACVHREYPGKLAHVLEGDADVRPPRELTPAFYGCYDWHSAVHAHWLLVRAARLFPAAPFAAAARAAVAESLTPTRVAGEVRYLGGSGRASFERPYGLAWLLKLAAELRAAADPDFAREAQVLAPLEAAAAGRLRDWLPKLHYPIRVGEHDQTAFAFGLAWDWAAVAGDAPMRELLAAKGREFYAADRACPLSYEPSGEDFLSPCLAEADFMRRVLPPAEFGRWLGTFLPGIPRRRPAIPWLAPALVTDREDPKLAHVDGLNLSRAWMLQGIEQGLSARDPRRAALAAAAVAHRDAALPAVTGAHYSGGHWLGTFALYLISGAGAGADR
jgi:hypothetical protein